MLVPAAAALLSVSLTLSAWCTVDTAAVLPTAIQPPGCTWQGKEYADSQQFQPDPCTSCRCEQGQPLCMLSHCTPPSCVDAVMVDNGCCPVCPNGDNCLTPSGTVIPAGKDVLVDNSEICRCQGDGFFMHNEAVCNLVGPVPPDGQ